MATSEVEPSALYFYVQSRSDSSLLIGQHIASKLGPFVNTDDNCLSWKEWKTLGAEDKQLLQDVTSRVADEKMGREFRRQHMDMISSDLAKDIVYREELVRRTKLFWLRKRSFFPYSFYCNIINTPNSSNVLVNHAAGEMFLTQKAMLVRCFIDFYGDNGYFDFHPHTYIFGTKGKKTDGYAKHFRVNELYQQLLHRTGDTQCIKDGDVPKLWILKPSTGSCGRGISILDLYPEDTNIPSEELDKEVNDRLEAVCLHHASETSVEIIIQSYINDPLLFKGYKFDYRVYLLIGSVQEPFVALYSKRGYLRVCSDKYNSDFKNRNAHITNFHVQRDHPDYDPATDTIAGRTARVEYDHFIDYLKDVGYMTKFSEEDKEMARNGEESSEDPTRKLVINLLDMKVKDCISKAVKASIERISGHHNCAPGQFALLGVDLLLDEKGRVWLIEFTKSPAFRMKPEYLKKMHSDILTETIDIATGLEARRTEGKILKPENTPAIKNSKMWALLDI